MISKRVSNVSDFKKGGLKAVNAERSHPQQDHCLITIEEGERLYKFYYFRPIAGRREHFGYRILTKKSQWNDRDGML